MKGFPLLPVGKGCSGCVPKVRWNNLRNKHWTSKKLSTPKWSFIYVAPAAHSIFGKFWGAPQTSAIRFGAYVLFSCEPFTVYPTRPYFPVKPTTGSPPSWHKTPFWCPWPSSRQKSVENPIPWCFFAWCLMGKMDMTGIFLFLDTSKNPQGVIFFWNVLDRWGAFVFLGG